MPYRRFAPYRRTTGRRPLQELPYLSSGSAYASRRAPFRVRKTTFSRKSAPSYGASAARRYTRFRGAGGGVRPVSVVGKTSTCVGKVDAVDPTSGVGSSSVFLL